MCGAGLSRVTWRLLEMLLGGSSERGMPGTPRSMAAFVGWGVFPRSGFLSGEGSGRRAGLCTRSLSTPLWKPQEGAVLSHEASFLAELRSGVTCSQRVGLGGTQREGWQRAGCSHLVLGGEALASIPQSVAWAGLCLCWGQDAGSPWADPATGAPALRRRSWAGGSAPLLLGWSGPTPVLLCELLSQPLWSVSLPLSSLPFLLR